MHLLLLLERKWQQLEKAPLGQLIFSSPTKLLPDFGAPESLLVVSSIDYRDEGGKCVYFSLQLGVWLIDYTN